MYSPTVGWQITQHVIMPLSVAILVYYIVHHLTAWFNTLSKRVSACAFFKSKATATNTAASNHAAVISTTASLDAAEDPHPAVVSKEVDFPPDWWTSPSLFQLEKRAILSKTWLHITHASLFPEPGDYRTFNLADFSFLLIRGRDGPLRAFHNVCRHRAYTVATRSVGRSSVLRCRYHGWTYNTRGRLVHAPHFDAVTGFDPEQNGLHEIRAFVDSSGFVYVNFDAYGADGLTIRVGVPLRARLTLLSAWTVSEAAFNWKFAVPTGALPVPSITGSPPTNNEDLDSRSIMGRIAKFFFSVARRRERRDESSQQQTPTEIELSPLTRLYRSPTSKGSREDYWLTITLSPVTPTKTTLHCALYQHAHSNHTVPTSTQPSVPIQNIQTSLSDSIHALESRFATQGPTGEISTSIAPSQEALLAETRAHARLEGWMGGEVHPASRWRETSSGGRVAEELCRELEGGGCMAADGKELAW